MADPAPPEGEVAAAKEHGVTAEDYYRITGERPPTTPASPDAALTAAFAAAQGEFPAIKRNNTAEVRGKDGKPGYSYTYADLGDVLNSVRPVLAKHGLAITQRTKPAGDKVVLRTELRHVGGGLLDTTIEIGMGTNNPQAFGGALTYLRRYEIVTLLGIAAEEDRDAQDVHPTEPNRSPAPTPLPDWALAASAAQKRTLVEALEVLVGPDQARAIGTIITNSIGHVPGVVVGATKLLTERYLDADDDEVIRRRLAAQAKRDEAVEAATAKAAQDAAENPDQPASEPEPQHDPDSADDAERAAAIAQQADPPDEHPGDGPTDEEFAKAAKDAQGPPAGSVHVDLSDPGDPDKCVEEWKAAGCTCIDPVVESGRADLCPIAGHGIPW